MPHVISAECTSCGACVDECPMECIYQINGKFWIAEDECTDCEACVLVCPIDCISYDVC